MTIQASDDFTLLGNGSSLNGRTLNNGLGGSGSRAWSVVSGVSGVDTGSLQFANGGHCRFDAGAATDYKATVSFILNGTNKNWSLFGRNQSSGNVSCFSAFLVGNTSLRVAEWSGAGARTDRATKAITALTTATQYKLQLELNGLLVTARVLNANDTLYDETSYTAGATPGGSQQYWGLADIGSSSASESRFDDFVLEDLDGGGGGGSKLLLRLLTEE